jgi:hypothetical protein
VVSDALAVVLTGGDTDYLDVLTEDDITKAGAQGLHRPSECKVLSTDYGTQIGPDRAPCFTTGKPLRN